MIGIAPEIQRAVIVDAVVGTDGQAAYAFGMIIRFHAGTSERVQTTRVSVK